MIFLYTFFSRRAFAIFWFLSFLGCPLSRPVILGLIILFHVFDKVDPRGIVYIYKVSGNTRHMTQLSDLVNFHNWKQIRFNIFLSQFLIGVDSLLSMFALRTINSAKISSLSLGTFIITYKILLYNNFITVIFFF